MPAPVWLQSQEKVELHTEKVGAHTHLVVEDHSRVATQFRVAATTTAATTIIVQPPPGTAIVITDLIVNQDKVASGVVTVQFTDGSDTVILLKAATSDAPFSMAHGFAGRMRGWKDARVEMISAGTNPDTNATVMYYTIRGEGVLSFADWNAQRG